MSLIIGPLIAAYKSPEIIYLIAAIIATIGSIVCGVVVKYDIEGSKPVAMSRVLISCRRVAPLTLGYDPIEEDGRISRNSYFTHNRNSA